MFEIIYPAAYISFLMVFIGMLIRTVFPYIQKYRELPTGTTPTPAFKWDHRYTLTILANLALCFIGTMLFFSTWSPPEGTMFQVAIVSFFTGWGAQDTINRLVA